jgi:spermidine synthase
MTKIKFEPGEYHKVMKPVETENYKITHRVMSKKFVENEKWKATFRGAQQWGEVVGLTPGTYVVLTDKNKHECVMSDTWMELISNERVIREAHGEVLLGGLGIGIIPYHLQFKKSVDKVTVVEVDAEIIEINKRAGLLNGKVEVIHADIFDWEPPKDKKWNIIFFDIWNNICSDNWEDMKTLTKKFKYKVDRNDNWMLDCWRKEKIKQLVAESKRNSYYLW